MARYNVTPTGPAGDQPWKVEKDGLRVSEHRTQQAAINAAERAASTGDVVIVHNSDGVVRDRRPQ